MKSKEKVQAAVMERLETKTGLNMKELDVTTTSVSFDKNLAYATVAIHPKGDATVSHGMSMKYTLQDRDGKWVVLNPGGARAGVGMPASASPGALPNGHPSVDPSMNLPNPRVPGENAPSQQEGSKGPIR